LSRKRNLTDMTCSYSPINAGKLTRRSFSLSSYYACSALSARFQRIGFIALFCGSLRSTVSRTASSLSVSISNGDLVIASICICIALLILTPNKQSPQWVFTTVMDGSGWGSKCFSFLLGFLSVAWTMTDYDGTTQ
jgi:hypothetical protein